MDAAVRLNPKLKLSPKYQLSAIHAITRLDLSSNDLSEVPDVIFQMQSLRFFFGCYHIRDTSLRIKVEIFLESNR